MIDLSKSKLKYLTSYIGNHVNFEMLDVSACELESLVDSIGAVKMFEDLYLSKQKINPLGCYWIIDTLEGT